METKLSSHNTELQTTNDKAVTRPKMLQSTSMIALH